MTETEQLYEFNPRKHGGNWKAPLSIRTYVKCHSRIFLFFLCSSLYREI